MKRSTALRTHLAYHAQVTWISSLRKICRDRGFGLLGGKPATTGLKDQVRGGGTVVELYWNSAALDNSAWLFRRLDLIPLANYAV